MWYVFLFLQGGQYGEVCGCSRRLCDLFVLSWARVRRVCMGSISFMVFIIGGVVFYNFVNLPGLL